MDLLAAVEEEGGGWVGWGWWVGGGVGGVGGVGGMGGLGGRGGWGGGVEFIVFEFFLDNVNTLISSKM